MMTKQRYRNLDLRSECIHITLYLHYFNDNAVQYNLVSYAPCLNFHSFYVLQINTKAIMI